jgi:hypothetical protein
MPSARAGEGGRRGTRRRPPADLESCGTRAEQRAEARRSEAEGKPRDSGRGAGEERRETCRAGAGGWNKRLGEGRGHVGSRVSQQQAGGNLKRFRALVRTAVKAREDSILNPYPGTVTASGITMSACNGSTGFKRGWLSKSEEGESSPLRDAGICYIV